MIVCKAVLAISVSVQSYGLTSTNSNIKDTINPMCPVHDGVDDTEHFLLLCSSFNEYRHNLLAGVNDVLAAYEFSDSLDMNMLELLL